MIEARIPPTPGIAIRNLQKGGEVSASQGMLKEGRNVRLSTYSVCFPGWIEAAVSTRLQKDQAVHRNEKITVLFDGYLTDIVISRDNPNPDLSSPASTILNLYQKLRSSLFSYLRGSFVILVIDETLRRVQLITDRRASRPVFYRELDGQFYAAAPTVAALAQLPPIISTIDTASLIEFMMSATFRGTGTLYPEISKLPYGSILEFDGKECTVKPYWRLQFAIIERPVDSLLEECNELLDQSVKRLLRQPGKKFLFLSGGVDSRVVLGYLRRHLGSGLDVASYWSELTAGDDASVAQQLVNAFGLKAHEFEFSLTDFVSAAPIVTLQADSRSEVIDSAPLYQFSDTLSQSYDGYINGDESFGWRRNVDSVQDALNDIGWFGLEQAGRLKSWISPELATPLEREIQLHLKNIISRANEQDPDNLKDKLYYEERLGNFLNAFSWAKLHKMEGYRPLVDEDVVDFVYTLPNKWRGDKQLLRLLLNQQFPDIAAIPFSKRDVLPTPQMFLQFLQSHQETRRFFEDQLIEKLDPRLASIFSTRQYKASIHALLNGDSLPSVQDDWLSRLPGLWRFAKTPENRVGPFALALRLVQLNLYLSSMK